jgi:TRAP-type transport system periplasmic protein
MTTTFPRAPRRALLLGTGALALPAVARAQTQYRAEYKLSVVGNRPIPLSEGAFQWADLVTQRSGGRINVKV